MFDLTIMSSASASPQVAIVTGANRVPGIGFEICRGLVRTLPENSSVILTSRDEAMGAHAKERLEEEEAATIERHAIKIHMRVLDIGEQRSIDALYTWVEGTFGGVNILVNNAGLAYLKLYL